MKLYSGVKMSFATVLAGWLLVPLAWAQPSPEPSTQKLSANESKASTPIKKGIARKAGNTRKGGVVKLDPAPQTETPVADVTVKPGALVDAEAQLKVQAEAKAAAQVLANKVNSFNRTMRPLASFNLPPSEDGIHDPANPSVKMLNEPLDAYTDLPRNKAGNRVDWVEAVATKKISPRWDRVDVQAERMVMDMDIVRVPKGSMPNVVFPHKQHTEWLACANCHPDIFVPQKGANQISMPLILSGQKCGVCHGKVAFPPSECAKCHSRKKESTQNAAGTP